MSAGHIFKKCVQQKQCDDVGCEHSYWVEFEDRLRGIARIRRSIEAVYGVRAHKEKDAREIWLPKFVAEVRAANDEGREPTFGHAPRVEAAGGLTVAEFVHTVYMKTRYETTLDDAAFRHRYPTTYYHLQVILKRFGPLPLEALSAPQLILQWKDELKARRNPHSAQLIHASSYNKPMSTLRAMLNWAFAQQTRFISFVPFGVGGVQIDTMAERVDARERRLYADPDEEEQLLEAARWMNSKEYRFSGAMMELRITAALDTGLRRGEMLMARGAALDWRRRVLKLPAIATDFWGYKVRGTKSGKMREVPLTPRLMALLEPRRLLGPHAYLFGHRDGRAMAPSSLKKPWNTLKLIAFEYGKPAWVKQTLPNGKAKKGNGFDAEARHFLQQIDLHWHDLRHEAASRFGESGAFSLAELKAILGHEKIETTLRYWNLSQTGLAEATAKFDQFRIAQETARRAGAFSGRRHSTATGSKNPSNR